MNTVAPVKVNNFKPETVLALAADRASEGLEVRTNLSDGTMVTVQFVRASNVRVGMTVVDEGFSWDPGLRLRLVTDAWLVGDDACLEFACGGGSSTSVGNMVMVMVPRRCQRRS